MSHRIFIERCRDSSQQTAQGLATALAQRYQIDPKQILGRLGQGRFQVKANQTLEQARAFVRFLEENGALCSIVDGSGAIIERSAELSTPSAMPEPDPEPEDELGLYTPVPPDMPSETPQYESGLAAAFQGGGGQVDIGALGGSAAESGEFTLEALDGSDRQETAKAAQPRSPVSTDDAEAFLPPEMLREESLELADELPEASALVSTPPPPESAPVAEAAHDAAPLAHSSGSIPSWRDSDAEPHHGASTSPSPSVLERLALAGRARWAIGLVFALLVGFFLAHKVASMQEDSKYTPLQQELREQYQAADSLDKWSALDETRATILKELESRRDHIAITAFGVWLVVSGLLLFGWVRLIDWSRWEPAPDSMA